MLHASLSAGLARSQTARSTVQGPVHVPHVLAGGIKSCRLLGRPAAASQRQLAVVRPRLRTTYVAATASTAVEDPASSTGNIPKLEREVDEKKSNKEAILFQGFGWDSCSKGNWYKHLISKVPDLVEAGCTHLWLPPPSQSVSPQGYMPGQLYNLNTPYGSKEDLKELIQCLKAAGISPMADIVINHRCADEMSNGKWQKFRDDVEHPGRKIDWGEWAIAGDDHEFGGRGNRDTGATYGPAPDLDHANDAVREGIQDWLNWLAEEVGYECWRLDFVKGYGAHYVDEYIGASIGKDMLCVGEYWVDMHWDGSELGANQDAARQVLCDWIDGTKQSAAAFDFPTKGILQEAVKKTQYWRLKDKNGKAPGLLGWWPAKAVTFTDNHDTGSTQQHWPFSRDLIGAGYAYIITHPGVPCIFWDHYFTWGHEVHNTIESLLKVRERNKIVSDSKLEIKCAEDDMYVAVIDKKVVLKMGPRHDMGSHLPSKADGWVKAASGKDFCVWEKKAS